MSRYIIPPKLPVPILSQSLASYINSLRPILSNTQLSEAIRLTKKFEENEGSHLQKKLIEISEGTDNWASQTFQHSKFLSNRSSLVLSNMPSMIQTNFKWKCTSDKLTTLSQYIVYLLNKVEDIRNQRLPQDMLGNTPFCMEQHKNLMGAYRCPNPTVDTHTHSPESKHIIIMHAGNIYKMQVYSSEDRNIASKGKIYQMLSQVLEDSASIGGNLDNTRSVGLLTAMDRDAWHLAREEMMLSAVNVASLKAVEQCLFGLALDGSNMEDFTEALKLCRFGDPLDNFSYFNRWFGLGFQIIFTNNGYLGMLLNHSIVDGSIVSLFEDLLDPPQAESSVSISDPDLKVELLRWELSPSIQAKLSEMKSELADLYKRYDLSYFEFSEFGKDDIKNQGINFQLFIQFAIQLAYYTLYNKLEGCFQSVSLRHFAGGRLEQPHIITNESKEFVREMNLKRLSKEERYALLKIAMQKHKEILIAVGQGQVYLQHILALKILAEKERMSVELFESESFKIFGLQKLVAPYIISKLPIIGAFATAKGDGHSVSFHSMKNSIFFSIVTILKASSTIPSSEFRCALESSLKELKQLIDNDKSLQLVGSKSKI